MSLIDLFEKLINERGSAAVLREHLAIIKAEQAELERSNANLKTENAALQAEVLQLRQQTQAIEKKLEAFQGNQVCDHCGAPGLVRIGSRPDPVFGELGAKQSVFRCPACGKESAFMQKP